MGFMGDPIHRYRNAQIKWAEGQGERDAEVARLKTEKQRKAEKEFQDLIRRNARKRAVQSRIDADEAAATEVIIAARQREIADIHNLVSAMDQLSPVIADLAHQALDVAAQATSSGGISKLGIAGAAVGIGLTIFNAVSKSNRAEEERIDLIDRVTNAINVQVLALDSQATTLENMTRTQLGEARSAVETELERLKSEGSDVREARVSQDRPNRAIIDQEEAIDRLTRMIDSFGMADVSTFVGARTQLQHERRLQGPQNAAGMMALVANSFSEIVEEMDFDDLTWGNSLVELSVSQHRTLKEIMFDAREFHASMLEEDVATRAVRMTFDAQEMSFRREAQRRLVTAGVDPYETARILRDLRGMVSWLTASERAAMGSIGASGVGGGAGGGAAGTIGVSVITNDAGEVVGDLRDQVTFIRHEVVAWEEIIAGFLVSDAISPPSLTIPIGEAAKIQKIQLNEWADLAEGNFIGSEVTGPGGEVSQPRAGTPLQIDLKKRTYLALEKIQFNEWVDLAMGNFIGSETEPAPGPGRPLRIDLGRVDDEGVGKYVQLTKLGFNEWPDLAMGNFIGKDATGPGTPLQIDLNKSAYIAVEKATLKPDDLLVVPEPFDFFFWYNEHLFDKVSYGLEEVVLGALSAAKVTIGPEDILEMDPDFSASLAALVRRAITDRELSPAGHDMS
jgi:hypothetical protein